MGRGLVEQILYGQTPSRGQSPRQPLGVEITMEMLLDDFAAYGLDTLKWKPEAYSVALIDAGYKADICSRIFKGDLQRLFPDVQSLTVFKLATEESESPLLPGVLVNKLAVYIDDGEERQDVIIRIPDLYLTELRTDGHKMLFHEQTPCTWVEALNIVASQLELRL